MQYTISVNQLTAVKFGLNLIEASIFEIIKNMMASKMEKRTIGDKVFTWIAYAKIIEEAPLLGITDKDVIGRHVKKLVEKGILDLVVDRKQNSKTYFSAGENFDEMIFDTSRLKSRQEGGLPSQKSEPAVSTDGNPPSQKSDNQYTKDQYTNQINTVAPRTARAKWAPGSLPKEKKAELDNLYITLDQFNALFPKTEDPELKSESTERRRKSAFAYSRLLSRYEVPVIGEALKLFARWLKRTDAEHLIPADDETRYGWAFSEFTAALALAKKYPVEQIANTLNRILMDDYLKKRLKSLRQFQDLAYELRSVA